MGGKREMAVTCRKSEGGCGTRSTVKPKGDKVKCPNCKRQIDIGKKKKRR